MNPERETLRKVTLSDGPSCRSSRALKRAGQRDSARATKLAAPTRREGSVAMVSIPVPPRPPEADTAGLYARIGFDLVNHAAGPDRRSGRTDSAIRRSGRALRLTSHAPHHSRKPTFTHLP
jgi:hypothetical protein